MYPADVDGINRSFRISYILTMSALTIAHSSLLGDSTSNRKSLTNSYFLYTWSVIVLPTLFLIIPKYSTHNISMVILLVPPVLMYSLIQFAVIGTPSFISCVIISLTLTLY